jgi:hypothetical protein
MPVWYVDPAGTEQGHGYAWGNQPPPPPPPPSGRTIVGYNSHAPLAHETPTRQSWWSGRAPMVRIYYSGMLPSSFDLTTTDCPEKRACVSFLNGSFTWDQMGSGSADAAVRSYVQSIPAGWTVYICLRHEANLHIPASLTGAQLVAAYNDLYPVIHGATLRAGVTVKLLVNYSAYQLTGSSWSDSWVPTPDNCDLLTFDLYGNPGNNTSASGTNKYGGPATGSGYGTTYAIPSTRAHDMFAIIDRLGYAQRWGILELNAPARDWDTKESGRALWHQDMFALMYNPPMTNGSAPDVVLLWEMDQSTGAGWNQSYGRVSGTPHSVADAIASYVVGSA